MTTMELQDLTGVERSRARVRGLVLAYGLASGDITVRELTGEQQTLAQWAVLAAQHDQMNLLAMQLAANDEYVGVA